ncbi:MAG TPA: RtcB family protein [Nitrososphaeraceae archaeon]
MTTSKKVIKAWSNDINEKTLLYLDTLSSLPFLYKHIAVMPNVCYSDHSLSGVAYASEHPIMPAAIGPDIGCGVKAIKLNFDVNLIKNHNELRNRIEKTIPCGRKANNWGNFEKVKNKEAIIKLINQRKFSDKIVPNIIGQIGTIDGGQHFIEISYDENDIAWLLIHSGSSLVGEFIANNHIHHARGLMKKYFINLKEVDFAYFVSKTDEYTAYLNDIDWIQRYAVENRNIIMDLILNEILAHVFGSTFEYEICEFGGSPKKSSQFFEEIDCRHNYFNLEEHFGKKVWITRKGTISARENELVIILGSMATPSYIGRGKGNADSFLSCAHGVGRKMSKEDASNYFTIDDVIAQTVNIESRIDLSMSHEIPAAYNNIEEVIAQQKDLVDILHKLTPIISVK